MHPIGDNGFIARRFTGVCMGVILGEAVGDAGAGPKLPQSELSTCVTAKYSRPSMPSQQSQTVALRAMLHFQCNFGISAG